jgi:3-methylfumaryl-CoA hydratase
MSGMDAALLQGWVGRRETRTDLCDARRVADLAATLDRDAPPLPGAPLPPGWHWMFFNAMAPARELGPDGHPRRGGFLPPVPLPRRMWAGGRLDFHAPIPVGATLRRESEIAAVDLKQGRSGAMVFVRVRHAVHADGVLALTEAHDIVYRAAPKPGAPSPPAESPPTGAVWRQDNVADPVLLFRYSALTANGHRIHYDHPYVTEVEGYPGLVVHGPLTATLLMALAETRMERPLRSFSFRNRAPLFAGAPIALAGAPRPQGDAMVWAATGDGALATEATVEA